MDYEAVEELKRQTRDRRARRELVDLLMNIAYFTPAARKPGAAMARLSDETRKRFAVLTADDLQDWVP